MPYVTSTGEIKESHTPLSAGWFWSLIIGIWNFFYFLLYTLISPGSTKNDVRSRRDGRGGGGGRGDPGNPWGGGGGGGPRQRPIGRPGGIGGAAAPECPPMAGGG